jgi:precorrin-6A/cobalt-precorrin-6A reductase
VSPERLLILGGTAEAAALARGAVARFGDRLRVTTSLAGRTQRPGPIPGEIRLGGFGGASGLAAYLTECRIDRLIDATHPFAVLISAAARLACENAAVPRLMVVRPPWRRHPMDRWIEVDDMAAAAATVGRVGRRAWLTVGARETGCFSAVSGVHFLVRVIDPPGGRLRLRSHELILARGPFSLAEERRQLVRHAIDVLVCKASGGAATEAKIIAARELGVPVLMVRRPRSEPGEAVDTVDAALEWLARCDPVSEAKGVS